ncbi:MAG: stage III sporulation protein AA [Firmicutes bacterium]|nr:stage III sporulation protein AA [Bacillota bacterium]
MNCALDEILGYFPPTVRQALAKLPKDKRGQLEEIRLRCGRPVMVVSSTGDFFLGRNGQTVAADEGLLWHHRHATEFLEAITRASLYAVEDDVRAGFITLPGGHRVGFVGQAVLQHGRIQTMKHIASYNVRLARAVPGAADGVVPSLIRGDRLFHTLIVSAPGCGKTTLLRDLTRQVSCGIASLGFSGRRVAVVDERSELAACWRGIPQLDVGPRTDVLDGCPKAEGIMLVLRSMSPQVIVTDEVGSEADAAALEEALFAGVTLLVTAHGTSLEDVQRRPGLARLVRHGAFERLVVLSRKKGPGTIERIVDLTGSARDVRSDEGSGSRLHFDRHRAVG